MQRSGRAAAVGVLTLLLVAGEASAQTARHIERIRYEDIAIETIVEGKGPAIVMLPSLGRDGRGDFDAVAARLAKAGFLVLRPQPRGTGVSTGPMDGVSLHDLARDVAVVIKAKGDSRAVIIGHAFGHFVARMTAVDYPSLVRGVVLAAAAAHSWPPDIAAAPAIAGNPDLPEADRLAALRLAFFAPGNDPRPWLKGWYPATLKMEADSREKQGVKQSDWWGAGNSPLLELIPEADPFKPRDKWYELRDELGRRVAIAIIPHASHALLVEQPDAVADAVIAWMRQLPP